MMRDECTRFSPVRAISPTRLTDNTAAVGAVVDAGLFTSVTYYIASGTLADADATFTALLEHSTDGVSFTAVDDAYLIGTEAAASFGFADDNKTFKIGYIGPNRYTRLTITPAGNSGNADVSAVAVLGSSRTR